MLTQQKNITYNDTYNVGVNSDNFIIKALKSCIKNLNIFNKDDYTITQFKNMQKNIKLKCNIDVDEPLFPLVKIIIKDKVNFDNKIQNIKNKYLENMKKKCIINERKKQKKLDFTQQLFEIQSQSKKIKQLSLALNTLQYDKYNALAKIHQDPDFIEFYQNRKDIKGLNKQNNKCIKLDQLKKTKQELAQRIKDTNNKINKLRFCLSYTILVIKNKLTNCFYLATLYKTYKFNKKNNKLYLDSLNQKIKEKNKDTTKNKIKLKSLNIQREKYMKLEQLKENQKELAQRIKDTDNKINKLRFCLGYTILSIKKTIFNLFYLKIIYKEIEYNISNYHLYTASLEQQVKEKQEALHKIYLRLNQKAQEIISFYEKDIEKIQNSTRESPSIEEISNLEKTIIAEHKKSLNYDIVELKTLSDEKNKLELLIKAKYKKYSYENNRYENLQYFLSQA